MAMAQGLIMAQIISRPRAGALGDFVIWANFKSMEYPWVLVIEPNISAHFYFLLEWLCLVHRPSVPKSNLGRFETRVLKHRVDDHNQRLDFSNQMVSKSSINDVWKLNWAEDEYEVVVNIFVYGCTELEDCERVSDSESCNKIELIIKCSWF
ncbi:hypothetical protein ACSBR2_009255 [Camellia fascicularis]